MPALTLPADRATAIRAPLLALAAGILALGLLFYQECAAAVRVWIESTAYGHCFLVAPMAAYLAWERRDRLRGLVPRPWPAASLLALPIAVAWLAADRLGIMEGRQLTALALAEVLVLAVLGWQLWRALAGPLLFLVFLVPFGAFLTPALQHFTARFVGVGLAVLGIPAYLTKFTIEIPEGTFYVAEACAGLRFLIAAVAFGVFFALLNYRSPGRRIAFIAASCTVPIIANGFRALGIVTLGHLLGSAQAAETDHILYGWLFFSLVLMLLVAIGLPFRETQGGSSALPEASAAPLPNTGRLALAIGIVLAVAAAGPAAATLLGRYPGQARLAAIPHLVPGPGCVAGDAARHGASRYVAHFSCHGLPLSVTLEALPPRATPDRLAQAERQLGGQEGVEDTEFGTLTLAHGTPRRWRLVETTSPARVTAVATWVDGKLAGGGLKTRLHQAWASLAGTAEPPVIVAAQIAAGQQRLAPDAEQAIRRLLAQFLDAQPRLPGGEALP